MKVPMVTTESGLQYKDIKVGQGPSPPVGFQVCKDFWLVQVFLDACFDLLERQAMPPLERQAMPILN